MTSTHAKPMNLQQLDHFLAVAETGSFSRAAERVHLTQPALSRSIASLEGELGGPLLDRLGRRNALTQLGERVAAHARRIRLELAELKDSATAIAGLQGGEVRVGLGPTPYEMLAASLMGHFVAAHPQVQVRITTGPSPAMFEGLRRRDVDALVVHRRTLPTWDDLDVTLLPALPLGFLCRVGHPLSSLDRIGFRQLAAYPLAGSAVSLTVDVRQELNRLFAREPHAGDLIHLQCDGVGALLELALSTDTVFFGVIEAGRRYLQAGALTVLETQPAIRLRSQFAHVVLRGAAQSPGQSVVRRHVEEAFGGR